MIHTEYRITCDCCNKKEYKDDADTEYQLLCNARHCGWITRSVPNGSEWDLCPKCSEIRTEDLP